MNTNIVSEILKKTPKYCENLNKFASGLHLVIFCIKYIIFSITTSLINNWVYTLISIFNALTKLR